MKHKNTLISRYILRSLIKKIYQKANRGKRNAEEKIYAKEIEKCIRRSARLVVLVGQEERSLISDQESVTNWTDLILQHIYVRYLRLQSI